jgi:flagellar M-ring protein FliF
MALVNVNKLSVAGGSFGKLPITKQLTVLLAISLSVALGVFVVLWSRTPNMAPLYAKLDSAETSQVIEVLQKNNIPHKFDPSGGGVLVPVNEIHEVRMKLAAQGLPKGSSTGYELLDKPQGFNTSQFMETVRYRRGLEGELAKTISSLEFVREARVHLGLPKQVSFLRKNIVSSASVMVDLYGGHQLDKPQVEGIVHLVASSVPELKRENITVVDQHGNLLTNNSRSALYGAIEEMNYTKQKEQELARKIQELLEPIYGTNGVKAEVTADIDFTFTEKTLENFDRGKPVVRSEAVVREQKTNDSIAMGLPGALSNQPPSLIGAPEKTPVPAKKEENETENKSKEPVNFRDQATRNYEVDKTITHEKRALGKLIKLSVAVVVNDRIQYDAAGTETRTPLTAEELTKVETLVKDAIGFNAERGDKVTIINSSFALPPPIVPQQSTKGLDSIIHQPWFVPAVKQLLGGIFILFILFSIIKPMIKSLTEIKFTENKTNSEQNDTTMAGQPFVPEGKLNLLPTDMPAQVKVEQVKQITHDDSKRAAQVVMNWVGREDE